MTERELVSAYVEGQIGRRAFLRRLVQSGVSVGAAVAYAKALGAEPARAHHGGSSDQYQENRLIRVTAANLRPAHAKVRRGALVEWSFQGQFTGGQSGYYTRRHTISDPLGFLSTNGVQWGTLNHGHRARRFFAAGTFTYTVAVFTRSSHGTWYVLAATHEGSIAANMTASRAKLPAGGQVTVSWASRKAPAGFVYDVQRRLPGGKFRSFRSGVTGSSAKLRLSKKGRHTFRARLRRLSDDQASGWSPPRVVRVT